MDSLVVITLAITITALLDIAGVVSVVRSSLSEGGSKVKWILIICFTTIIGPVIWFVSGRWKVYSRAG